jgi:hypothetical protein
MENEFSNNFENELNNSLNLKSLEEFFNKEITNSLSPQEIMITSLALNHISRILNVYNIYSNVAVFDVKAFIEKHPEHANVDFTNLKDLDEDTLKAIENSLHDKDKEAGEEFNKGDILIKNIIEVTNNIALKLYSSYTKEYSKRAPEDTEQFFTILNNCLENAIGLLKSFFSQKL